MEFKQLEHLIYRDYPMSKATSFKVGGPADYLFRPETIEDLQLGLQYAQHYQLPITVIGCGSNLLVTDKGIRGFVIQLAENFSKATVHNNQITATSGCYFSALSKLAAYHSLTGLEFAVGIPGSLGGAIYMNAGAYDGEIGPLIEEVVWVTADEVGTWSRDEFTYSYRNSKAQEEGVIVAGATLQLAPGNPEEIYAKMNDFQEKRRSKQPLEYPSAGSTFKRPPGRYVGPMIEEADLKGYSIGGAQVSTKHAGFIINTGNATATDIINLIEFIQKTIKEKFDVDLIPEVRIIGEK
ncbi:MAG: UDP-N-acetylmuramate dehydrogenase [Firmicutes bacterium]|nr:UDP-N-acetylmuramate dehydrogenase [Bacillota bacterium]